MTGSAEFQSAHRSRPARDTLDHVAAAPRPNQSSASPPPARRRRAGGGLRPSRVPVPGAAAAVKRLSPLGGAGQHEGAPPGPARSAVDQVLTSPGRPLAAPLRAEMEGRLGADFSDVRLHIGAAAGDSAAAIGARAYTRGSDVVIRDGGADKRTLAHELAHVIQQRTGPVAGTGHGNGLTLSDPADPYERAAELTAARALSGAAARPQAAVPANAAARGGGRGVVQRTFEYQPPAGNGAGHRWLDTDTGIVYIVVRFLASRVVEVRPVGQPGPATLVLRQDRTSGEWQARPGRRRRAADAMELVPEAAPKNLKRGRDEVEEEEEADEAAGTTAPAAKKARRPLEYVAPAGPTFARQAELWWTDRGLRLARLSTGFTAQVDVAPVSQGRVSGEPGRNAIRYSPDQVIATGITVGNKDRPNTYLEPKPGKSKIPQGRHTVAWSFLRRSFAAMTGMTVQDILIYLHERLEHISGLVKSEEGQELLRLDRVSVAPDQAMSVIGELAKRQTELPIQRWQADVSEAIRYYAQIYHMSIGATFAGKSTSRGESDALVFLGGYEERLRKNEGPTAQDAAAATGHAANLLDVNFTMKPQAYAFAVAHWIDLLTEVYPAVMHHDGLRIVEPELTRALKKTFLAHISAKKGTVSDLLRHEGYTVPDEFGQPAERERPEATGIKRYAAVYGGESEFVASVVLDERLPEHTEPPLEMTPVPGQPNLHAAHALTAGQVVVGKVRVSDLDRPVTQFQEGQKSHTVAWTLIRAELASFAGQPLPALFGFLEDQFRMLATDAAGIKHGTALVAHAQAELASLLGKAQPIHAWQRDASLLVKWYAHAHQLGRSTTFYDAESHGAKGHGEADHMEVLMANELSARENRTLVNPRERVIEAAVKLLDVIPSLGPGVITTAVVKWQAALTHAFPVLLTEFRVSILAEAAVKFLVVNPAGNPGLLQTAAAQWLTGVEGWLPALSRMAGMSPSDLRNRLLGEVAAMAEIAGTPLAGVLTGLRTDLG